MPQIIQLSPSALPAGDPAFTLTVTGKNFASNAVLLWDGAALSPTLFISHTQLQAFVGADLVALPGPAPVTAANPGPGGGAAQALFYRLWQAWSDGGLEATRTITTPATPLTYTATLTPTDQAPLPRVYALDPPKALSGGVGFTLTVIGKNFASDAVVVWDGAELSPTVFISSTRLEAAVGAALIAAPGPAPVSVRNHAPGGGLGEAVLFVRLWRVLMPGVWVWP